MSVINHQEIIQKTENSIQRGKIVLRKVENTIECMNFQLDQLQVTQQNIDNFLYAPLAEKPEPKEIFDKLAFFQGRYDNPPYKNSENMTQNSKSFENISLKQTNRNRNIQIRQQLNNGQYSQKYNHPTQSFIQKSKKLQDDEDAYQYLNQQKNKQQIGLKQRSITIQQSKQQNFMSQNECIEDLVIKEQEDDQNEIFSDYTQEKNNNNSDQIQKLIDNPKLRNICLMPSHNSVQNPSNNNDQSPIFKKKQIKTNIIKIKKNPLLKINKKSESIFENIHQQSVKNQTDDNNPQKDRKRQKIRKLTEKSNIQPIIDPQNIFLDENNHVKSQQCENYDQQSQPYFERKHKHFSQHFSSQETDNFEKIFSHKRSSLKENQCVQIVQQDAKSIINEDAPKSQVRLRSCSRNEEQRPATSVWKRKQNVQYQQKQFLENEGLKDNLQRNRSDGIKKYSWMFMKSVVDNKNKINVLQVRNQ